MFLIDYFPTVLLLARFDRSDEQRAGDVGGCAEKCQRGESDKTRPHEQLQPPKPQFGQCDHPGSTEERQREDDGADKPHVTGEPNESSAA